MDHICVDQQINMRQEMRHADEALKRYCDRSWSERLQAEHAIRGPEAGGNKLRTYRTFKHEYATEQYVKIVTQKKYRSAYAKFRCGVAPIKVETCRYGLNRLPLEERLCETCNVIEDEFHVIMICSQYTDIRNQCFTRINELSEEFKSIPPHEQFTRMMSDSTLYTTVSKAMYNILNKRRYDLSR